MRENLRIGLIQLRINGDFSPQIIRNLIVNSKSVRVQHGARPLVIRNAGLLFTYHEVAHTIVIFYNPPTFIYLDCYKRWIPLWPSRRTTLKQYPLRRHGSIYPRPTLKYLYRHRKPPLLKSSLNYVCTKTQIAHWVLATGNPVFYSLKFLNSTHTEVQYPKHPHEQMITFRI